MFFISMLEFTTVRHVYLCIFEAFFVFTSIENTSSITRNEWIESYRQYFKCYPIQCWIKLFVYHFSISPVAFSAAACFLLPHQKKKKIGCFWKIGKLKSKSQHLIGISYHPYLWQTHTRIHTHTAIHTVNHTHTRTAIVFICNIWGWKSIICFFHVGYAFSIFQQWQFSILFFLLSLQAFFRRINQTPCIIYKHILLGNIFQYLQTLFQLCAGSYYEL